MRREIAPAVEYPWNDSEFTCAHPYILPRLQTLLKEITACQQATRILDLGCGNGSVTGWLASQGFNVVGVDPSAAGIEIARAAHPAVEFWQESAYDLRPEELGTFSAIISLEVIEHVYDPPRFVAAAFELLRPGGFLLLSTPYHGWLKNVAIAVLGRFDDHVDPLSVHGHIKFWSAATLTQLLEQAGFQVLCYRYVGRIRPLAKSILVVARRPKSPAPGA